MSHARRKRHDVDGFDAAMACILVVAAIVYLIVAAIARLFRPKGAP